MANLKSILDSVHVSCGIVHFPSRYAAREVMETMEYLHHFTRDAYRILAVNDGLSYVVFWRVFGTLLDVNDLSCLKSDIVCE